MDCINVRWWPSGDKIKKIKKNKVVLPSYESFCFCSWWWGDLPWKKCEQGKYKREEEKKTSELLSLHWELWQKFGNCHNGNLHILTNMRHYTPLVDIEELNNKGGGSIGRHAAFFTFAGPFLRSLYIPKTILLLVC